MELPLDVRFHHVKPVRILTVRSIRRHLSIAGTAVLALASAPADAEPVKVAKGNAADLRVRSVSLKDTVKLNYGIQGQLQGAGPPNEAGIGAFAPLKVNQNSVWFLDALANVNFAGRGGGGATQLMSALGKGEGAANKHRKFNAMRKTSADCKGV